MVAPVAIGNRQVGPGCPCFIIAEAGVNHNGDLDAAKRLVEAAARAGADAVKFQSFKADRVVSASAPKADYQLRATDPAESHLGMLRRFELSAQAQRELNAHCQKEGVVFLSTAFDEGSLDLLDGLGVRAFKIGSGEITNWQFLESVARKGRPVILSTGMSYLGEVDEAVRVIRHAGCEQLILLHCVSDYPADPADANLRAMKALETAFQVPVGFSDHTRGIEVALAAVALGACVIEKHFTLDRDLPGPDHKASLEPEELQEMIAAVRTVERALGDGLKRPAKAELTNRASVRRSLVAVKDIPEGAVLRLDLLGALRPATGISPALVGLVVGRKARRSLRAGEILTWGDLD
jgi:N-acetylneuraminate synthase/N,N'-diacetyllegionaminate synthase